MASPKASPLERSFRYLLHRIGTELSPKNCHSLRFLHDISKESREQDEPGLDILQELRAQAHFSPLQPDRLEEDLGRIKRQDLANLVKQYKKSDGFKKALKPARKGVRNGPLEDLTYLEITVNPKSQQTTTAEERCGHMLSITFMHAAQSVDQSRSLVEAIVKEAEQLSKEKEVAAAIGEVRRDFERLGKSLKKAITTARARNVEDMEYSIEETRLALAVMKPMVPPRKGKQKNSLTHSVSYTDLTPLARSHSSSTGSSDISGASSSCKSEEDLGSSGQYASITTRIIPRIRKIATIKQELGENTADSGYDNTWDSTLPTTLHLNEENREYSNVALSSSTEYTSLSRHTREDSHNYADFRSTQYK